MDSAEGATQPSAPRPSAPWLDDDRNQMEQEARAEKWAGYTQDEWDEWRKENERRWQKAEGKWGDMEQHAKSAADHAAHASQVTNAAISRQKQHEVEVRDQLATQERKIDEIGEKATKVESAQRQREIDLATRQLKVFG
eukprot:951019-Alexandrium_andersonii.AAC.1